MDALSALSNNAHLACGALAITVSTLVLTTRRRRRNPNRLPLPPGPKGYPIIGNLYDMPSLDDFPWVAYDKMRAIYGDMIFMNVLGQPFLVLGSLDKVQDLFEKRSTNYSNRPWMTMVMDLMGWDFNFAFKPYGSEWKKDRRVFHDYFHPGVVHQYKPTLLREAHSFLRLLLDSPDDFKQHIQHIFSASIMHIAYGITVEPGSDNKYVTTAELALKTVSDATMPGRFFVDFIPVMKYIPEWFPGAYFQRQATIWRNIKDDFVNMPFNHVKKMISMGKAVPCMVTSLLEKLPSAENDPNRHEEEERIKSVAAIAFAGGADTTVSALQTFFLAMTMYPEVQKKAQAELDAVVGVNRLPDFDDESSLPYIGAVVKECMRWQGIANLGLAHSVAEDDEYNGYFIPKGTIVMGNTWAILNDPTVYQNPSEFIPDRFLKDGQLDPSVRDPSVAAFGYGRRICPGRFLSDLNLYILAASTLAAFDIQAPLDDAGNPVRPEALYTSSPLSHPLPFKCRITPRSQVVSKLVQDSGME